MRGAVLYRSGDVRFEERAAPANIKPTGPYLSPMIGARAHSATVKVCR
jgi:hypothetical protein